MELSELVLYAREKYHIEEQHKWAEFPGFSVLVHPQTGKWVALLMRQWDPDLDGVVERCDLKCGQQTLSEFHLPYLSRPIRMKGPKWISIAFSRETDRKLVFRLFDRAFTSGDQRGFTMVLENLFQSVFNVHRDTPIPLTRQDVRQKADVFPERIRQMNHLYEYGSNSLHAKAANFYRQAVYMADFEDHADYPDPLFIAGYFPTYHDLTTRQLRVYFTWRTFLRKGTFQPIAPSGAYIYIYELLNLVGARSPEDALEKLEAFEHSFIDRGFGDEQMRHNLKRWMTELAIVHGLSPETVQKYADPAVVERDQALSVLRVPEDHTDEEVFSALCLLDGNRPARSPVIRKAPEKGMHLFAAVWKQTLHDGHAGDNSLFSFCFGDRKLSAWYPFANAVYCWQGTPEDRTYQLNPCRSYLCQRGVWQMLSYDGTPFLKTRFHGLLRQTDLLLRRYLKTGGYLKDNPDDLWAAPCVQAVIAADQAAAAEAARPKLVLDLSALEQIRQDALITRDSLLTDEERDAEEAAETPPVTQTAPPETEASPDLPLDGTQLQILRLLLSGKPADALLREHRLMPTITADNINEALFDVFGDNILECDHDTLSLVEDYREDLSQLLGGKTE